MTETERIIGTFSAGIAKRRHLPAVLGARVVRLRGRPPIDALAGIAGWGRKDNTQTAIRFADRHELPYLSIEDGFIRSIGLGVHRAEPFAFIIDRTGIYYDATRPSDLEALIGSHPQPEHPQRAAAVIQRIVTEQIYKYNHVWRSIALPDGRRPKILLVDQTRDDMSVKYGMATGESFLQMLHAARERYPGGSFYVKTHPDVIAGKKRGYLTADLPDDVTLIHAECNPYALISQIDHVYTVTSQMGFEALLAGKPVSCFGMPFYAGWGLTEDALRSPRRNVACTIGALFEAAFLKYVRYVDPVTGRPCDLERILDRIVRHKRVAVQNSGNVHCVGFRFWKRGIIRRYLDSPQAQVRFSSRLASIDPSAMDGGHRIVVWGLHQNRRISTLARRHHIPVERVEDGFLRSVGLGSDFARPSSLIIDRRGIYFDPRSPSDLEDLLNTIEMDDAAKAQARQLRQTIVLLGMSKYNAGRQKPLSIQDAGKRATVLVPGQVEDDASIAAGCVDIRTNLALVEEVRRRMPDAYIIYKPHPDVLAGNRRGRVSHKRILAFCDRMVTDRDISVCLEAVDQVHTMTSLAGFEALLRGKTVATYGLPFYAGWGLTDDRHSIPRRRRRLDIDELVYGSLIRYPRYYDWQARCFVGALDMVDAMRRQMDRGEVAIDLPLFRHLWRKAGHLLQLLRDAWH